MDNDFQEIEAKAAQQRQLQELEDFHHESSGDNVGRIARHAISVKHHQVKNKGVKSHF